MPKRTPAVAGHISPLAPTDDMDAPHALAALAALGQPTRLEIFKLLMHAEPAGLPAGSIADRVGSLQSTLSAHLAILARSGLVSSTREGRSIIYRARVARMRALIDFLIHDCCEGHPELCGLVMAREAAASESVAPGRECSAPGDADLGET